MRSFASAVVAAVLASACTGPATPSGQATSPPGATPTAGGPVSPKRALDDVRTAVAAVRAAKTGEFVTTVTLELSSGRVTVRQAGAFDVPAQQARITQGITSTSRAARLDVAKRDPSGLPREMHIIFTKDASYFRTPGWPASVRDRWLRLSESDIARAGAGQADLSAPSFPLVLTMLDDAAPSPRESHGTRRYVTVPARSAFESIPTAWARALVVKGLDPNQVRGSVDVEITIDGGRIRGVRFDVTSVFADAYRLAGDPAFARSLSELRVAFLLQSWGKPARIDVPGAGQLVSEAELREATR